MNNEQKTSRERSASDDALDDIALLCDSGNWEYPGQVVRDVAAMVGGWLIGLDAPYGHRLTAGLGLLNMKRRNP